MTELPKAELTRERILQAAFEEMHQHGYQGMRVDSILKKTQLAKGALYHHFPNKKSLGYAVVDEHLLTRSSEMAEKLSQAENPLEGICELLTHICEQSTPEDILLGCPVCNLSQEMSSLDDGFKSRLCTIYTTKMTALSSNLDRGKALGLVRDNIDSEAVSGFILSSYQGVIGAAKCLGDKDVLTKLIAVLCDYIRSLKN